MSEKRSFGDFLIVDRYRQGPFGDFVYPPKVKVRVNNLVLVAGGSGITPILSIIESALTTSSETSIKLIYACRSFENIMFYEKLKQLKMDNKNRFSIHYAISEGHESGRLDEVTFRSLQPSLFSNDVRMANTHVYICGPDGLKNMLISALDQTNVPAENIHVENSIRPLNVPKGPSFNVSIQLNSGKCYSLAVASNQTVFEVAKASKVNLPHACCFGTCGSCKVKINRGKTEPIEDSIPGITAKEKSVGLTLLCQCKPLEDLTLSEL